MRPANVFLIMELSNSRVQLFHMTSAAAQKAQGVSDVFGSDVAVLDVHWIYQ